MRWIFLVMPGSIAFPTSDMSTGAGDTSRAFFHAHCFAAKQAAGQRVPSYVLRLDTGTLHYGFGTEALVSTKGVLREIVEKGYPSLWDFKTKCWLPLPPEGENEREANTATTRVLRSAAR